MSQILDLVLIFHVMSKYGYILLIFKKKFQDCMKLDSSLDQNVFYTHEKVGRPYIQLEY